MMNILEEANKIINKRSEEKSRQYGPMSLTNITIDTGKSMRQSYHVKKGLAHLTHSVYIESMSDRLPFKPGSLLFAPMEGVTEESYRLAVSRAFPEWDLFATDFLRVPSQGTYKTSKIMDHFGNIVYRNEKLKNKTTTHFGLHNLYVVRQKQELAF